LDELVRTKPADNELVGNPTDEHQEWVGRARALISTWDAARGVSFNSDCDKALAYKHQHALNVEVRTSSGIHGRFLCVDSARSFLVDASFKDAAKSAPAALIELTDTAATSLAQYQQLWLSGTKVL
jgi:hypothetical protein